MIINNEWKQQTQLYNSYIITARRKQMMSIDAWIHAGRSWRDLRGLNSLKLSSRPHDAQTASAQADIPNVSRDESIALPRG